MGKLTFEQALVVIRGIVREAGTQQRSRNMAFGRALEEFHTSLALDAKKGRGWVTLKNGVHVYINAQNKVSKGPNMFIGKSRDSLAVERDAEKVPGKPSKTFQQDVQDCGGNYIKAALAYYKREMQGRYVDMRIGGKREQVFFSRATGKGKNGLLQYLNSSQVKAELVPYIPQVITAGRYLGKESPKHLREDYSSFHVFERNVQHDGKNYRITVKVGEHKNGMKSFSFYYFKQNENAAWDSSCGGAAPSLTLPSTSEEFCCARAGAAHASKSGRSSFPHGAFLGFIVEEVK